MNTVTVVATSKYTWYPLSCDMPSMEPIDPHMLAASPQTNAHTDHATAATTPSEISVSMVAVRCRRFIAAERWNGHAPHVTTGALSSNAHHCQLRNCQASIIDTTATGIASASDTSNRRRSNAKSSSYSSSLAPSDVESASRTSAP